MHGCVEARSFASMSYLPRLTGLDVVSGSTELALALAFGLALGLAFELSFRAIAIALAFGPPAAFALACPSRGSLPRGAIEIHKHPELPLLKPLP